MRLLTELRAKHATVKTGEGEGETSSTSSTFGIDGVNGKMVDMKELGVWEPFLVKSQTIKTAIEVCMGCLLCFAPSGSLFHSY